MSHTNTEQKIHLAIIPDGNRRWAKARKLKPWQGHESAMTNFRALTQWCHDDPRVGVLTAWAFSTENWKRSEQEKKFLWKIIGDYLENERKELHRNKTRFIHSGRKDRIPTSLAKLIKDLEEETKDYTDFTFNLALDYGGKDEVVRAIKKLKNTTNVTEEAVAANLDHPDIPDIDIIIRTGGDKRISNFFMWEGAYAELFFLEKHFPDLNPEDLEKVVTDFATRERRFGGG